MFEVRQIGDYDAGYLSPHDFAPLMGGDAARTVDVDTLEGVRSRLDKLKFGNLANGALCPHTTKLLIQHFNLLSELSPAERKILFLGGLNLEGRSPRSPGQFNVGAIVASTGALLSGQDFSESERPVVSELLKGMITDFDNSLRFMFKAQIKPDFGEPPTEKEVEGWLKVSTDIRLMRSRLETEWTR